MEKLDVGLVYTQSFRLGLKNFFSIIGTYLLWIITIWIPYINVGTTIAFLSLPLELSKGKVISPTYIFDSKYRQRMGEFFILCGLKWIVLMASMMFLIIPGLVMNIAYSMSLYIMLDRNVNPLEALKASNETTYGNKWRIFFSLLLVALTIEFGMLILGILTSSIGIIGVLISAIVLILSIAWLIAVNAVVYKELTTNSADEAITIQ